MTPNQYKSLLPKPKLRQIEYKLHVEVVKHLRSAFPQVLFTHAGKGKSKKHGEDLKKMGYRKGTPDLLLWWKNALSEVRAGAIELKAPDGDTTTEQDTFDHLFTRLGGHFACCKSIQGVHDALVGFGLKPLHGPANEPTYATLQEKYKLAFDVFAPLREKL